MHKGVFLCFALVVALVHASPLASDQTKKSQAPTVVDVPAGIFDSEENPEKSAPPAEAATSKKDEAKIEDTPSEKDTPEKTDAGKDEAVKDDEEVPSIFGIRFPSVVIFRRPIIRDPFAGFQSPFFSRRPSIFSPSIFEDEDREAEVEKVPDQKPLASSAEGNDSRVPPTHAFGGMTDNLHQRISDMFTSIFNIPSSSFFSRPTFSRPMFSRPSIFSPFSPDSDEDSVDFDKLPENYSNSTSETKVVDGQVVTVNKTIHKVSGNNSNGFFHFQVIKFGEKKPENESAGAPVIGHEGESPAPESEVVISEPESGSNTPKHPEMDPQLNEVDRPEDEDKEALLSQKEMEAKYDVGIRDSDQEQTNQEEIKIVPFMPAKLIKAPNGAITKKATDLSSDIRVNSMMAENIGNGKLRALYNPDEVEVFDV